jgi:hypothetical protein
VASVVVVVSHRNLSCPHVDFDVLAVVHRFVERDPAQGEIPPATGFTVDLKVECRDCHEPFVWVGRMPIGVSPGEPRVSVDGTELHAPIRPASAGAAFGLNRPGFGVRFREEGR